MNLQGSSRIQVVKGHVSAEVHDETVVLHQGEGVYYGLNASGAVLWQALQAPRTIAELTSAIQERFDVPEDEALRDVQQLVSELLEKKLVELLPG